MNGQALRLLYIRAKVARDGMINRRDIMHMFKVTAALASGDFRTYQERFPGHIIYDPSLKTFVVKEPCSRNEPILGAIDCSLTLYAFECLRGYVDHMEAHK